jgi:hypothetical protein
MCKKYELMTLILNFMEPGMFNARQNKVLIAVSYVYNYQLRIHIILCSMHIMYIKLMSVNNILNAVLKCSGEDIINAGWYN